MPRVYATKGENKRDRSISVMLTKSEYESVHVAATRSGMTDSTYVRWMLLRAVPAAAKAKAS